MDSVYPEPLSLLYRRAVRKKVHKTNAARYRTQPVTFSEIQEVDEEKEEDGERSVGATSKSELDLKAKFEEFKMRRDQDLRESRLAGPTESVIAGHVSDATPLSSSGRKGNLDLRQDSSKPRAIPKPVVGLRGSNSHPRPSI